MTTTVLLDGRHLGGYSANRGIGTYLRNVLTELVPEPKLRVVALVTKGVRIPEGVTERRMRRIAPPRYATQEHDVRIAFDLSRAARLEQADVVWSPADDPPRRSPRPWVQFLHDLIPLVMADSGHQSVATRWRRVGPRLRDAAAVITNSRHTAADATKYLGIRPERLHVAPLGVGPEYTVPAHRERRDPPTILYVGEYGAHKGFAEAFEVAGRIADAGLPHRLAMVGYLAPWFEPVVTDLRARAPHPDRIDLLGYVDDVVAAYQHADALIVTSRYEGFCLPAVEAMACGTPVVAFSNSAISEVVADGGALVADGDVAEMVGTLRKVLTSEDAWQEASGRAIRRAADFSWAQCAHVHAEVFRAAGRA